MERNVQFVCFIGKNKHLIEFIVAQKSTKVVNKINTFNACVQQLDCSGAFAHIISRSMDFRKKTIENNWKQGSMK